MRLDSFEFNLVLDLRALVLKLDLDFVEIYTSVH